MKRLFAVAVAALGAALLAAAGFYVGRHGLPDASRPSTPAAAEARKVLYWHDPMVPGQRFDQPGKSPFMDMQLVPVYAGEANASGVKIDAGVQQNLGIRTATVERAEVASSFDAVGTVEFDERLSVAVQTRVAGYVERLAVRAPMERVRQGQTLATIFAPDWLGPQNEWLALKSSGAADDLVGAARARLRALSIPDALVRQSEAAGTAQARFALVAPVGGVVAELGVREGVATAPGTTLFRIAGLDKVWAVASVPEAQAVRLVRGQKVKAVLQADAGRSFDGELEELLPQVSAATRTLQARFTVDNRSGRLVPGLLLRLQVAGPASARLLVPAEAIIRTGTRVVAVVRRSDGGFEPRDIRIGADLGERVEVVDGLAEGEQVVASGQFLIDSEAGLRAALGSMGGGAAAAGTAKAPALGPMPMAGNAAASAAGADAAAAATVHLGEGRVESIQPGTLTLSHGPIASLKWPAMTMGFKKAGASAFADIKPGDQVRFAFRAEASGDYTLVSVQRVKGGP